ncbi:MAG: type IV pilus assembly protein PilM [bacterium]|nr:type IV pilus assembly protein PilM [bacterium]
MAFFKKKLQAFLGVDIGAAGVKLVELRSDRGRARLSTYGVAELPMMDRPATTLGSDVGALAEALKELCGRAKVEATHAVTSLPVAAVFSSVITLPRMAKKQLPEAVAWEAKKLLPLPYEEMITDWKLLTPEEDLETENTDTATARVLLTAAPKELVQQYISVFRGAGLELVSLETEAFALIRSLVGDDPAVVLLIDIGASRTSMIIVEDGTPMLSRSVDVGGKHMTRAMGDATGVAFDAAEQLKLDLAVTPTGNIAAAALPKLFDRLFSPVIQEARYAMNLHQSQDTNSGRAVEKVILAGGSAMLPSLTQYVESALNLRTFVGDPWARVIYPVDLRPALDAMGPRFAVSIGLGMREVA